MSDAEMIVSLAPGIERLTEFYIASLAGNPGYWFFLPPEDGQSDRNWRGVEGESMTGPLHAAALAMVRSKLAAEGIEPPALLTPVLYELANDPTTYARVFQDVTVGDDHVFNDTCCEAGPGYDLTTGRDGDAEVHRLSASTLHVTSARNSNPSAS